VLLRLDDLLTFSALTLLGRPHSWRPSHHTARWAIASSACSSRGSIPRQSLLPAAYFGLETSSLEGLFRRQFGSCGDEADIRPQRQITGGDRGRYSRVFARSGQRSGLLRGTSGALRGCLLPRTIFYGGSSIQSGSSSVGGTCDRRDFHDVAREKTTPADWSTDG